MNKFKKIFRFFVKKKTMNTLMGTFTVKAKAIQEEQAEVIELTAARIAQANLELSAAKAEHQAAGTFIKNMEKLFKE